MKLEYIIFAAPILILGGLLIEGIIRDRRSDKKMGRR